MDAVEPRFSRYPAYKDSGFEWLGSIPAHWEVRRLKTLASIQLSNIDKKSVPGEEPVRLCNYVDVYYNERIRAGLEFMTATATKEQIKRFSLRAGDVLITKDSESWTDIAVSAVVVEDLPNVLCGYHLALIRPRREYTGEFLAHAFAAVGPRDQFQIGANGITRFGLSGDAIATGVFAIPPANEQRAIAIFLDRETARIDSLVANKGRLIELLQEKRTAVITHATTKGLKPEIPMKDSGVEWLGKIPTHWEVKALKRVAALSAGTGITSERIQEDGKFPVFGGNGVRGFTDSFTHEGDFPLVGRQGALCGCVNFATGKFWASEHAVVASPRANVNPRWLSHVLTSMSLNSYSESAAQPGLSIDSISVIPVGVPPHSEQRAIVDSLESETAQIDALIGKIQEAAGHLRELRTALVSAAVTGKMDVREGTES